MALVGNRVLLSFSNPMIQIGALNPGSQWRTHQRGWAELSAGEARVANATDKAGLPFGYRSPGAWLLPQKGGAMCSSSGIAGTSTVNQAGLAAGLPAAADLAGFGEITDADLRLLVFASAALAGSGALSADVVGVLAMVADLSGAGTLEAGIRAIGYAVANVLASGTVSAAPIRATASISSSITSFSELSPQSLASAVWNTLVSQVQGAGTTGAALSVAGSGGLSVEQQTMLRELYRLAGLDPTKPLVVTTTSRAAGAEISQTVTEASGEVTVTRI